MLIFNQFTRTTALRLTVFSAICFIVVSFIYWWVKPEIDRQAKQAELAQFKEIAQPLIVDASILDTSENDVINGHPVTIYTMRDHEKIVAYFIKAITSKGYSGNIELLIGISADRQKILGVRVLEHHETPGLGDKIETRISDWIHTFDQRSLKDRKLAVTKDGGDVDVFTGATITPRAVTNLIAEITKAWQEKEGHHE